jgi:two-component system response regulator
LAGPEAEESDPQTRAIPVVIPTSSKEERDFLNGYQLGRGQLGANRCIQKPVEAVQFRETSEAVGLYLTDPSASKG